jgi:ABC-type glycerol-3-phosphate transport system substrate-binding protein
MRALRPIALAACLLLAVAGVALATGAQEKQKVTLRWTDFPEASGDVENGNFMKALRARFPEVTFKLEPIPYSALGEKFPVLMASGDMPDIYETNSNTYLPQLVAGNLAAPLDDALAKYGKDIVGNARDGHLAFGQFGGKQYGIPGSYSLKYFAQNIRVDWLEKLKLAVPKTMDEFRTVARAFTFNDPDGNGKADTYGTAFRANINFIDSFFHAYGVAPGHHQIGMWRVRNGKHTNDWVQPEMKEALMNLASWYKEGLIHPESLTFDWNQWWAAYLQNKVGMWYHQPRRLSEMNNALQKSGVANAKMWPIDPPKGPYGQGTSDEGQPWATFFGPKNLSKAIEVFNYTYTQEFFLASKGELDYAFAPKPQLDAKGWPVYYNYQEALSDPGYEKRRTDVQYSRPWTGFAIENPNQGKTWPNQELARYVAQQFANTLGEAQIEGNRLADKWAVTSSKTVPVPADARYFVNLQTKYREMCTQIVSGKDANQVWNDWLAFYKSNGGPEIEAEVNQYIPVKK